MPVRKVSNRGGNVIGKFPSLKMKRMVSFESLIELDFIHLLEFEPEVEWFEEQPLTIEYQFEGKALHYTPDFHIVRLGRHQLVECKPDKFVDKAENQRKFRVATTWCTERGWDFEVVTADQLRAGYRLENIKFLTNYARHPVDPITRSRLYNKIMSAENPFTLLSLAQDVEPNKPATALAAIFHLAFLHEITIPLDDAPISPASLVNTTRREL